MTAMAKVLFKKEKGNKIKIPKSFNLCGCTINVVMDKKLLDTEDAKGISCFRQNKIIILENGNNVDRPIEEAEISYFHEVCHFVLYYMGEHELKNNEKFVELFARLLHQVFKTAKY